MKEFRLLTKSTMTNNLQSNAQETLYHFSTVIILMQHRIHAPILINADSHDDKRLMYYIVIPGLFILGLIIHHLAYYILTQVWKSDKLQIYCPVEFNDLRVDITHIFHSKSHFWQAGSHYQNTIPDETCLWMMYTQFPVLLNDSFAWIQAYVHSLWILWICHSHYIQSVTFHILNL